MPNGIHDFRIGNRNGDSATLTQDVENDIVAIGLRYSQSGGGGGGILPQLRCGRAFIPCFNNRRATLCLYGNHFGSLSTDPSQLLHLLEGLPHPDHPDAASGGIDDALWHPPPQLLGYLVAHGLFPFDAEWLFQS